MRINFISTKKDNNEKNFWENLTEKMGLKKEIIKMASQVFVEKPSEIVKEGLVISYKPSGEYTIKLGHRADIVVSGVAKQEKELHDQVSSVLSYLGNLSPKVAKELQEIERGKREILVYKDIDKCRDCVWYESDTSHETYRDKCKNCNWATLGGTMNHFFPRSQQMVVFTPEYHQVGAGMPEAESKKAFQGSFSLLDAHRKGQQDDRNPELIADEIVELTTKCPCASCIGTALLKYFQDNKLNFQRYGKAVIDHIEKKSRITMHIKDGKNIILAVDKQADSNIKIDNITVKDKGKIKFKLKDKSTEESQENAEPVITKESGLRKQSEGDVTFQKYDRVHLKSDPSVKGTYMEVQDSKPGDIDDLVVFDEMFEETHVVEITPMEIEPEGIEATDEQKAFADEQFAKYQEEHKEYEKGFEEKVEGITEGKELEEKAAGLETPRNPEETQENPQEIAESFVNGNISWVRDILKKSGDSDLIGEVHLIMKEQFPNDVDSFERNVLHRLVSGSVFAKDKKEDKVVGHMPKHKQDELDEYEKVKDNYPKSKEIMPKGSQFAGTLCLAEVK